MKRPLSTLQAALAIARLTRKRLWRGKLLRIATILALAPALMMLMVSPEAPDAHHFSELFQVLAVLLVVIPALLLSPWLAEEMDDRTYTYLWSRPLPRGALMLGKLAAMLPVALGLCALTVVVSFGIMFRGDIGDHTQVLAGSLLGLSAGAFAWCASAVGIGSLVPKYATAAVIVYFMFLDSALGGMPYSIQNLAMSHHVRTIASAVADDTSGLASSVIWLASMSAIWLGLAAWRVTVAEYSTED